MVASANSSTRSHGCSGSGWHSALAARVKGLWVSYALTARVEGSVLPWVQLAHYPGAARGLGFRSQSCSEFGCHIALRLLEKYRDP
jgi:hypothetical protein